MDPDDKLKENNRPEMLEYLDTFNTAPEFGMLGILQEEERAIQQAQRAQSEPEDEPAPSPEPEPDKELQSVQKYFDPINSSIQEMGRSIDNRFGDIERRLETRATERQQVVQQPQQLPPGFDPEAPVTMNDLWKLHQEWQGYLSRAESNAFQTRLDNARMSAHLELERFKRDNPGFNISAGDFDRMYQAHVGNDLGKATGTNWRGMFELTYAPHRQKTQLDRIAELEKENAELKKGASAAKKAPPTPISPAVQSRRSTPAIQSPTQEFDDDDIVNLRSFKKGKSFKSFANEVMAKKGIRLGR